ncbi:MAG: ATP-dependent protease ATPase subunit HslU, partial [Candidatus Marinimicrobia bacterium]|nr:ATP-dependent protease ATPase subunit HslU [Candidatus Neomarinimicrobiota bacterium]
MKQLTPKQIVKELDRYIVGQKKAKKAVAIALRNRWRRQQVEGKLRDEIMPNNIIMIGSTGVGKTEIARRLASLSNAPFIKVEASKFTEVGYVGRDVESMVRDLMDTAISMVEREKEDEVVEMAELLANERILDILFPDDHKNDTKQSKELKERHARTRGKIRKKMEKGEFENKMIDVEVSDDPIVGMQVFGPMGMEDIGMNIKDMISGQLPKNKRTKKMAVSEAREVLLESEAAKLIDHEEVIRIARERTENTGIIFLDEIDKVVGSVGGVGPDVSREGVQRDLLPIVEGSNVSTKYGIVATDHILFIAAGAFHVSTPSDMIPELQGRFPIRVELDKLTKEDFVKILTHPRSALIKQYKALLGAENVELEFNDAAIKAV